MNRLLPLQFLMALKDPWVQPDPAEVQAVLKAQNRICALQTSPNAAAVRRTRSKKKKIRQTPIHSTTQTISFAREIPPLSSWEQTLAEFSTDPSVSKELAWDELTAQINSMLFSSLEHQWDDLASTLPVSHAHLEQAEQPLGQEWADQSSIQLPVSFDQSASHSVITANGTRPEVETSQIESVPQGENTIAQTQTPGQQSLISDSLYVEAFDPLRTVLNDVQSERISFALQRGWKRSVAEEHWPTVSLVDAQQNFYEGAGSQSIPLLHNNTVKSFEQVTLGGIVQKESAAILFGKVGPSWEISLADATHATPPLFLSLAGDLLSESETAQERYFVFLNVVPGSHVLRLTEVVQLGRGRSSAVVLPLSSAAATYVDLTEVETRTISGIVKNADSVDSEMPRPYPGITVRVVGQDLAASVTVSDGSFVLPAVTYVKHYPILLETDLVRGSQILGFKHRYQIYPQDARGMRNLVLFRMPAPQIREWVDFLDMEIKGGLSSESGLVLGAVPGVLQSAPTGLWAPAILPLTPSMQLFPKAYALTPGGELRRPQWIPIEGGEQRFASSLSRKRSRFLGAEVPEGPAVAQVVSIYSSEVLWSELIFASPGVINMIGPY